MKFSKLFALSASAAGAAANNMPGLTSFEVQAKQAARANEKAKALKARNFDSVFTTDVDCDWNTEETCYDEFWNATSCATYADGGCPCPEGEEKCGASEGYGGYCTSLCCDWETEETCFDDNWNPESCAAIADGGCPCDEGEEKCPTWWGFEQCTSVCCNWETEETCFDDNFNPESCAVIADGGCPCPEGEEKCGAFEGYPGYCTPVCCNWETEETCYDDDNYNPDSCALIADGGCPCPEGEEKCGASEGYAGYCTSLCCNQETEETCYDDDNWNPESCAAIADGGCPSGMKGSFKSEQPKSATKKTAYLHAMKMKEKASSVRNHSQKSGVVKMAQKEKVAFLRSMIA